jgi:hypothetical protein
MKQSGPSLMISKALAVACGPKFGLIQQKPMILCGNLSTSAAIVALDSE